MADLLRVTVGDLLDGAAERFPQNEILIDIPKGKRYSYKSFQGIVNQIAKGFIKLGLEKGDRSVLWSPNRWEWIVTQFALAKIGAVLIGVDQSFQAPQMEYLLRQSDSKSLIMTEGLKGSEYIQIIRHLCPEIDYSSLGRLNSRAFPELRNLVLISDQAFPGMMGWKDMMEMGHGVSDRLLMERQSSCRYEDVATLFYTSGTTGFPKGVMSTHLAIINNAVSTAENQRLTEKDRLCLSIPLSHMFGSILIVLGAISKGATIVIPSETFNIPHILGAIEMERCTAIYGTPGSFIAMMEDPQYKARNLKSLRTGIMGGALCPIEVMNKVMTDMGAREMVIGYGQTECSGLITETRPDDPLELRVSTVGKAITHMEVKIVDPQKGEEAPTGVVGEICVRGFNMKGYYKMPAATANVIDGEGWVHTGDLGTMDEAGYVRTSGRLKEIISKGKEIIYPIEIEEVLFNHPKILNAQVFGVPDKKTVEEVAAWIKLEEGSTVTPEEILQFCRGKLPDSHLPRYVKFVKDFPTTPLGKVQKFKMREMAIKEYKLAAS